MTTTLVISPHTDDAELGAGATIARLVEEGHRVHVACFSDCRENVPAGWPEDTLRKEHAAALRVLGIAHEPVIYDYPVRRFSEYRQSILDDLIRLRDEIRPDRVICPSSTDRHQDHRQLFWECLRAFRCSVWGCIYPWNTLESNARAFIRLEERHVERKIEALLCYRSQVELGRPYLCADTVRAWARTVGLQAGCRAAEAYEIIREVN